MSLPRRWASALFALMLGLSAGVAMAAAAPYTPARGDPARAAIMDGLRASVRDVPGLDRPVVFRVHALAVLGDLALATVKPSHPDGRTVVEFENAMDCDHSIVALLRREGGQWRVIEREVGPCDYGWPELFAEKGYPPELLRAHERILNGP
jgi:hypothetical protein